MSSSPQEVNATAETSASETPAETRPVRNARRISALCRWGAQCKFVSSGKCRFTHPHPEGRFSVVHFRGGAPVEVNSYFDKFSAIEKFHTVLPPALTAEAAAAAAAFALPSYYHFQLGVDVWALIGLNPHDMMTFVRLPPTLPPTVAQA